MTSGRGSYESRDSAGSSTVRRRSASHDEDEAPGYKRQRIALACDSCRYRKSRCNGERPVCTRCRDMGFQCIYRGPVPAPKPQQREMQTMENRLQKVEELLLAIVSGQQGSNNTSAPVRAPTGPDVADLSSDLQSSASPYSHHIGFQPEQANLRFDAAVSAVWPLAQEDTVDGMGSITFADESTSGHFGPSSNSSFFSHIARALATGTGTLSDGRDSSRDLAANLSRPASPPLPANRTDPRPVNPYTLPSRPEILRLVEIFFSITGQFFPYISKSSIIQMVEELDITKFSGVRKSWLCLLNAILAIGTSLDGDNGRPKKFREAESDMFFQRALVLSPWTISNTANLETLQALAVMTQYLQGTSKSAQTWRLHGLLVQTAFQTGVHTKDTLAKLSAFEQEVRTRTWYICIVLDRMLSMTFGRPPLIHNDLIQTDLPQDVELDDLPKDDTPYQRLQVPVMEASSCALFIASIKLYRIQGDIICTIYNHNVISSCTLRSDELVSRVVSSDHELTKWRRELPPAVELLPLEFVEGMEPQSWKYSQAQTVLTLRYLNLRTLLFRRVLEHLLDQIANPNQPRDDSESFPPMSSAMVHICAMTSVQTITIIHKIRARPDLLPAWWFTAYYIFNSSLIIFGVICLQILGKDRVGSKSTTDSVTCLKTALEALDVVGKDTRIGRRCSKYLKKMIQVSSLLVRNHTSDQPMGADASVPMDSLPYENPPSTTDGSSHSPLQVDFGQFLFDEDFSFLDFWTDAAQ